VRPAREGDRLWTLGQERRQTLEAVAREVDRLWKLWQDREIDLRRSGGMRLHLDNPEVWSYCSMLLHMERNRSG